MIATVDLFNAYSNNYEDSEDAVLLKTEFLKAAEGIVTDYLGFSPEEKEYRDVLLDGTDKGILYLPARNITKLSSLAFDGEGKDISDIILADDRIEYRTGDVFRSLGRKYISLSFMAGWDKDSMPSTIRLAVLRIATLMLQETGGNIGLTGKSFADNSRTFVSYSNYRKYLEPLSPLRIRKF